MTYLPAVQADTINELRSGYLDHQPDGWTFVAFPRDAQVAPVFAISEIKTSDAGRPQILLTGNASRTRVKIGEIDANHGILLQQSDQGWQTVNNTGLWIRGDVRSTAMIQTVKGNKLIVGRNNLPVLVYDLQHESAVIPTNH